MTQPGKWIGQVHVGDCRRLMRAMAADGLKVQCVVTSPPYWGLRDYGAAGQFGLELTWIRHVARIRHVFRLVDALLEERGTLWLNYGDSYAGAPGGGQGKTGQRASRTHTARIKAKKRGNGLKPKDLVGMPWRVAFALQADGWYLRSDIIWHKPNPMPESISDRPTKSHEYLFLLSKSDRYHYDAAAIAEPASPDSHARAARARGVGYEPPGQIAHHGIAAARPGVNPKAAKAPSGWATGPGAHNTVEHAQGERPKKQDAGAQIRGGDRSSGFNERYRSKLNASFSAAVTDTVDVRNIRDVWTIPSEAFPGAHFATFPRELVRRCILAGSKPGDVVFDPFMGSGTVAQVAEELGRRWVGCELNPEYAAMLGKLRALQGGLAI